ncbi:hypothetical protein [Melissospora conviva]|uniref:hypothetical protein n=1 Tax=Melissospora conviva TaxID=3388432 RepID=UPI003C1A80C5
MVQQPAQPAPHLPAGTVLHLKTGEWSTAEDPAGGRYVDVRLTSSRQHLVDGRVWVYGHALNCAYAEADCTRVWCVELAVDLTAVADNLGGHR